MFFLDGNDIVNGFSGFLVNVEPKLAGKLRDNHLDREFIEKNTRNPNSIFLSAVQTKEIVNIVKMYNYNLY